MFAAALPRLVLDMVLPPRCPACGAIVTGNDGLCASCWGELRFLGPPWCAACQQPLAGPADAASLCADCLVRRPAHDGVRATVAYGPVARDLAVRMKHGGREHISRLLGRLMSRHAEEADALLVPVPLHRWRLWSRGFNQSLAIAREIGRVRGLACAPDALIRVKATPKLGGLGRAERARQLAGAVRASGTVDLGGRTILLVDDVYTSGATASACTRALKRAGAERVVVIAWARVLRESVDP